VGCWTVATFQSLYGFAVKFGRGPFAVGLNDTSSGNPVFIVWCLSIPGPFTSFCIISILLFFGIFGKLLGIRCQGKTHLFNEH
jgi:hypothetical protein